ncbi:hypothetical protein TNIN_268241 [Trichonephila inaurata madagascariensis]|uniref:Uncharacterized protein n=1 Tax=Trichonephila inaurata madagascariensis TaxID=2747483 RepID=A0A8X6XKN1_9ARAC|nr:hypothetical protein TNIN_268241 [Trichonephila inaurata madagascariensis]
MVNLASKIMELPMRRLLSKHCEQMELLILPFLIIQSASKDHGSMLSKPAIIDARKKNEINKKVRKGNKKKTERVNKDRNRWVCRKLKLNVSSAMREICQVGDAGKPSQE